MDNKSYFTKQLTEELWCDENTSVFYYKFKDEDEYIEGTLDFSQKKWTSDMKISVAKATLQKEKNKNKQLIQKEQLTFDNFITKYVEFHDVADFIEKRYYEKYIKNYLGMIPIEVITEEDIKHIFSKQQNHFKLSVYKITSDFIIRVFDYAVQKNLIPLSPCKKLNFKYAQEKQYVKLIQEKITEIYDVVNILFHNKPLVISFFLFLIHAKKKKKILNLKWELIDFDNSNYRIETNISKLYYLHPAIKEELLKVRKSYGYVYQNDIDSNKDIKIPTISEESYKINNYIPEFSIKLLESLVEEFKEREVFGEEINLDTELRNSKQKQIPEKKIIKPKLNIGKFSKKT